MSFVPNEGAKQQLFPCDSLSSPSTSSMTAEEHIEEGISRAGEETTTGVSNDLNSSSPSSGFGSMNNTTLSLISPTTSGQLKFSIESILQPGFGNIKSCELQSPLPSSSFQYQQPSKTSPQEELHSPLDERANPRFPAWIFCTRYSDRPSSGTRTRKTKRKELMEDEKRPRTAFTVDQLNRLKQQFLDSRYLTEKRRQELAHELGLNESQIKIWFQNKRAKLKKTSIQRSSLAIAQFMSQGLYANQ